MSHLSLESHARTWAGRRGNNEDNFQVEPHLGVFAVADGMGGYEGGEIASQLAVEAISRFFHDNACDPDVTWPFAPANGQSFAEGMVEVAMRLADSEVCAAKTPERERMGSTLSVLLFRNQHAVVGHLGDSRIYRLRRRRLSQLTRDHSVYEELRTRGTELPPRAEFAWSHMITRALGMAPPSEPDVHSDAVCPGDVFLLCTDGLSGALSAARIQEVLGTTPTSTVCDRLVREAYEAGSKDNITAVVVKVLGVG